MLTRLTLPLLVALALAAPARAQSLCPNTTPGFTAGGTVFGRLSAQWSAYFGAKVDADNGVLCNPTFNPPLTLGFAVAPGLTNTLGTRNPSGQTVHNGDTVRKQLYPVSKTITYTLAPADTGALLIAGAPTVTFLAPNPAPGSAGAT